MKNKLTDLNNILFEVMERLNDESLTGDALDEEIKRSKAIADVASHVILNANTMLKAKVALDGFIDPKRTLPDILDG